MSTLSDFPRVSGARIIPFAVKQADLERCIDAAKAAPTRLALAPFRARRVALIQTELPRMKPSLRSSHQCTTPLCRARRMWNSRLLPITLDFFLHAL